MRQTRAVRGLPGWHRACIANGMMKRCPKCYRPVTAWLNSTIEDNIEALIADLSERCDTAAVVAEQHYTVGNDSQYWFQNGFGDALRIVLIKLREAVVR